MTNREYLDTLTDEKFVEIIYSVIREKENAKFKSSSTPQENFARIKSAIKDWLTEDYIGV